MNGQKPNVLWIMADQLRACSLSCYGDDNINTKNIDMLAKQGVRFDSAYSHYPVCMCFRAGLVTGQYANINGVRVHGDLLKTDKKTIAHAFREQGYRTSWVGKWHLASVNGVNGWFAGADYWVHPYLRGGFEDWYGFELSNHYYNTRYCSNDSVWPPLKLEGYQTDALTDISLEYLSEKAIKSGRPWFHCISYEAPHPGIGKDEEEIAPGSKRKKPIGHPAPLEYEAMFDAEKIVLRKNVPESEEQRAKEKFAGYYAQIANLDYNIGRLLDWLEESGQMENTLVVFFSDHGELGGSHGLYEKRHVYDESIHIPLIMRLPGVIPEGKVETGLVSGIDIYPTCAGICNVPIDPQVQGIDHTVSIINGEPGRRSEVLIQWLGRTLYGWGDFQYRAIRTTRYTYCVNDDDAYCFLFDNEKDEYQMLNHFYNPDYTDIKRRLHRQLCNAIIRSGENIPQFVAEKAP